jgi:hypothetical protein
LEVVVERVRTTVNHVDQREATLLALRAGLDGKHVATLVGELARLAVAEMERTITSLGTHPADGLSAKRAVTLWGRIEAQHAEHADQTARGVDAALSASDRRTARHKAAELLGTIEEATAELQDLLRAIQQARLVHDTAASATVDQELAEAFPAALHRQSAALVELEAADAELGGLIERSDRRYGRGQGLGARFRAGHFPVPGALPDHRARLAQLLAPLAHGNGRVWVRRLSPPTRKFSDKQKSEIQAAVAGLGVLDLTAYQIDKPFTVTPLQLEAAEPLLRFHFLAKSDPPATPASNGHAEALVPIRLLRAHEQHSKGAVAYWPEPVAADLVRRGIGELADTGVAP